MKQAPSNHANQRGFASIIIAITLVIVTSLIVVGFARLARNEQTQVTDRHLSNQAYYAAETGINDATKAINSGFKTKKTTCGPLQLSDPSYYDPGATNLRNNNLDATPVGTPNARVQWTCLLIDPAPSNLEYSPVSTESPKLFRFSGVLPDGVTPTTIHKITFAWQDADPSNQSFASVSGISNTAFPPLSSWVYSGILRVSITPLNVLSRNSLRDSTYTAYLYPSTFASSTVDYDTDPAVNGSILNGGCSTANIPRFCSASINLPALPAGTNYLVSMRSIYSKTNVSVVINGGAALVFGAQAKIDSTGRSQDVLKRLQVRVPTKNEYYYPGFGVEAAGDICKSLGVRPGYASGCGY